MTAAPDDHQTARVADARAEARAQESADAEFKPYLPASTSPHRPADVEPAELVWAETVAPGGYSHKAVARGTRIRFEDPTGEACVHLLLYNLVERTERLNVADTVKIPWQAYLGAGHPLLSGEGRALATITQDSSGHHDAFCGTSNEVSNGRKYGSWRPEGPAPSGRDLFILAAAKQGLTPKDLAPSVSFFQGVRVGSSGELAFTGSAGPGASVELLAELPLVVLIANVPHPLDPRPDYVVGPLRVHAWKGQPTSPDDALFRTSPEAGRAYLNSISYAEARGL